MVKKLKKNIAMVKKLKKNMTMVKKLKNAKQTHAGQNLLIAIDLCSVHYQLL